MREKSLKHQVGFGVVSICFFVAIIITLIRSGDTSSATGAILGVVIIGFSMVVTFVIKGCIKLMINQHPGD